MRKLLLSLLLSFLIFQSAFTQEESPQKEQSYLFQFKNGNDILYAPYKGNEISLKEFSELIKEFKPLLDQRGMYILVENYDTKGNATQTVAEVAFIQRNRVKSELIIRAGVTEDMFVTNKLTLATYGSDELSNVVLVTIPASIDKIIAIAGDEKAESVKQYHHAIMMEEKAEADAIIVQQREKEQRAKLIEEERQAKIAAQQRAEEDEQRVVQEQAEAKKAKEQAHQAEQLRLQAIEDAKFKFPIPLSFRANLLHWATTTMNLGFEVHPTSSIGVVMDFDYAPLKWNNGLNGYRAFNFQPQVRYYFGKDNGFYAGGEFHVGSLNWKLKEKGHQGNFIGGGVVFGYKLPLNDCFDLDFNLGGGYTNYKYDKYMEKDGKLSVYLPNQVKNYWGLTSAGVTLVWKIFK